MKNINQTHFTACLKCLGQGKIRQKIKRKVKLQYLQQVENHKLQGVTGHLPPAPRGHLSVCPSCDGTGLMPSAGVTKVDMERFPHIAIVGGGIGGIALAVACLHRGIPFTIYERDSAYDVRSQGYGLTLQQASGAIEAFGINQLEKGVISTRHLVHTPDGKVIAEWGRRKWLEGDGKGIAKRSNIHISRQGLRHQLLQQLGAHNVQWNHKLVKMKDGEKIQLTFETDGILKTTEADLVVGADGIRSMLRKILIGEQKYPLRYLECIVILGICKLSDIKSAARELLDASTVFQTANGNERIYVMPYEKDSVMWQLSFPMTETEAVELSAKGAEALKEEARRRTLWHEPIPQILKATPTALVSGYPVYDRKLLEAETLQKCGNATLIGDAAHPMSPFKGQGANQAVLDALYLARAISKGCKNGLHWRETGLRKAVLNDFEEEMIKRSAVKVKDSADAAQFLHSEVVLHEGNEPRGTVLKNKKEGSE